MEERVSKKQEDLFYQTAIRLQMEDWEKGKMIMDLEDAEFLYNVCGVATNFKNGKVEFINDKN